MTEIWTTGALDGVPRIGWIETASPVQACPKVAERIGVASFYVKRDDLGTALGGGSKPRKLDYLLAQAQFAQAEMWASVGALGSGHLVAVGMAARQCGKRFVAHCFAQPPGAHVERNLAMTASLASEMRFYRSRATVLLAQPRLVTGLALGARAFIVPGGSSAVGMIGLVRAGLELAEQVRRGELPAPDEIVVAWGSGGTVAGLSWGLALGGLVSHLRAVSAVEAPFATVWRLRRLQQQIEIALAGFGVMIPTGLRPCPVTFDTSQVGPGYGIPTEQSLAACGVSHELGASLEPIYTGKAIAALLQHKESFARGADNLLYWHTARGNHLQADPVWQSRLPPIMRAYITAGSPTDGSRRTFVMAGVGGAAAVALGAYRLSGYPDLNRLPLLVLSNRQAATVAAAAETLIFSIGGVAEIDSLSVVANVDTYVAGLSRALRFEIQMLLFFVEHGTLLGLSVRRFTRMSVEARARFVDFLARRGGLFGQAYRGLRDLCLLGYYQSPQVWPRLGYAGPWVPADEAARATPADQAYRALRAGVGELPRSAGGRGAGP